MAKELNTVFVTEELRAGTLSKRVNAFKWNKRYFSVVPFELRWWSSSKKEGTPRTFPLNENTKLVQKETKIEIINGDKRIRLKGKDAKVDTNFQNHMNNALFLLINYFFKILTF